MAISQDDLQITITVDSKGAVTGFTKLTEGIKETNKAAKESQKTVSETSSAWTKFKTNVVFLNQGFQLVQSTLRGITQTLGSTVTAFLESEKAEKNLINSMRILGEYSDSAFQSMKDFSVQMQDTSEMSDETAMSMLSVAKSMGLTNEMAKTMVQTAADLGAATGKDAKTSFEALTGTLVGMTRGVKKYAPEIENLTEKQLKAGAAVEILSKKFKGFSAESVKTVGGAFKQQANAFGDFEEDVGKVIVELFSLEKVMKASRQMWMTFRTMLNENSAALIGIRDSISNVISSFAMAMSKVDFAGLASNIENITIALLAFASPAIASSITTIASMMTVLMASVMKAVAPLAIMAVKFTVIGASIAAVAVAFDILMRNMDKFEQVQELIAGAFIYSFELMKKAVLEFTSFILRKLSDVAATIGEAYPQFAGIASTAMESLLSGQKALTDAIIENEQALENVGTAFKDTTEGLDLGFAGKMFEEGKKFADSFTSSLKAMETQATKSGNAVENIGTGKEEEDTYSKGKIPELFSEQSIDDVGKALTKTIGSEFASATTGMMSDMTSMLAGPLGLVGAANTILDAIDGLIKAIPNLLNKVADILNLLVDFPNMLLNSIKNVGKALGNFIANFIPSMAKGFNDIIGYLMRDMPKIIMESINKLIASIPEIVGDIIKYLFRYFITMGPMIGVEIFKGFIEAFALLVSPKFWEEVGTAITQSLKESINEFANIFGMKDIFKIDTKEVEDTMNQWGRSIASVSEDVFSVLDMAQEARALDIADRIGTAINGATNRLGDILKKAWNWITDKWRELWNWISEMWSKLMQGLKDAWTWIYDTIIKPIGDAISGAFKWIKEQILDPFINGIQSAFSWISDNIIKPLMSVVDSIFNAIGSVFNTIGNFFKQIFDMNFSEIGTKIGEGITSAVNVIMDGLRSFMNIFVDLLNGLRIPEVSPSFKVLGKSVDFTLIPAIDLIPGDLPRFQEGGIVKGKTKVSGDSEANDTVLALLSPGEAVVPRSLMNDPFIGGLIRDILSGGLNINKYADGNLSAGMLSNSEMVGSLGSIEKALTNGDKAKQTAPTNIEINLEINTTKPIDDNFISSKLIPAIRSNIKKASLNGEFVLSQRGIRA